MYERATGAKPKKRRSCDLFSDRKSAICNMPTFNPNDKQGGKAFGEYMAKWESSLDEINKEFLENEQYNSDEELPQKLGEYKKKFIECDQDLSGDLNIMDVKYMLEKLGQAKTHLELKKMIKEVDTTNTEAINYRDFVRMMLGPQSGVLKMILMFEAFGKTPDKPKGPPPKRDLSSLP